MQKFRNSSSKLYVKLMVFSFAVPVVLALPIASHGYECVGQWCTYDDPVGWVADCATFIETTNYPAASGAANAALEDTITTLNKPNCDTHPDKQIPGPIVMETRNEALTHTASFSQQTTFSGKTGAELDFALADSVGAKADGELALSNGTSTTASWQWTTTNGLVVTHPSVSYTVPYGKRIHVNYTAKTKDGNWTGGGNVEWSVCENLILPPFTSRTKTGTCENVSSDASGGRVFVPESYKEYPPTWTNETCASE